MKALHLGKSIILPHARYVRTENSKVMMMFHSFLIKTKEKYITLGCNNMDDSGFCKGHEMNREEFIRKYCKHEEM